MSKRSDPAPLTPEQVKAQFAREGKTFSEWAAKHGYKREDVYKVINGLTKCRRGESHRIAVHLGLKANPEQLAA